MSNQAKLRAALALISQIARMETEKEIDGRGGDFSNDDFVSTLNTLIESARDVLNTPAATEAGNFYESWSVSTQDEANHLQVVDSHGTVVALIPCLGDDQSQPPAERENQPEYAERIATCVNFCAEISSEQLSRLTLVEFRDAAMAVATNWESNRLADHVAYLEGCATDLGAVADSGNEEGEDEQ